jgi:hypothetical protein
VIAPFILIGEGLNLALNPGGEGDPGTAPGYIAVGAVICAVGIFFAMAQLTTRLEVSERRLTWRYFLRARKHQLGRDPGRSRQQGRLLRCRPHQPGTHRNQERYRLRTSRPRRGQRHSGRPPLDCQHRDGSRCTRNGRAWELTPLNWSVLRRVIRNTCPPGDVRQSEVRICRHMRVPSAGVSGASDRLWLSWRCPIYAHAVTSSPPSPAQVTSVRNIRRIAAFCAVSAIGEAVAAAAIS